MRRSLFFQIWTIIAATVLLLGIEISPASVYLSSSDLAQAASTNPSDANPGPTQSAGTSNSVTALAPLVEDSGNLSVDPQVQADLQAQGKVDFWLRLRQSANLSSVPQSIPHRQRSTYVYNSLTAVASASQARILAYLKSHGLKYESHWIIDAILVYGATQEDLAALEAYPEVLQVMSRFTVQLDSSPDDVSEPIPVTSASSATISIITDWGLTFTHADQVWSTYYDKGAGIVVASIDTGVLSTHPALVNQYRGTSTGSNDYNWFMPADVVSQICTGTASPCDDNGHGTHTVGTMVGDDGGSHQTGMAPQAQWIACKAFNSSGGANDNDLITCAEWIVAPTDVNGQNPDPSKAPDIVNNSWGESISGDTWFQSYVQAWVAAGIFPTFAAGNYKNGAGASAPPGSIVSPADYAESFATGAIDSNGNIAFYSDCGPSSLTNNVKPDLTAPGVSISSTWLNNGYALDSGTSMASPHTAGAVALLWSAVPSLKGNISETVSLLHSTANPNTPSGNCGAPGINPSPNYTYGYGYLDALALVAAGVHYPTLSMAAQINSTRVDGKTTFAMQTTNPTDGTISTQALLNVIFKNTIASTILSLEYDDGSGAGWQPVTLTQNGTEVDGHIGASTGFPLTPGYNQTTSFRISWNQPGSYPILFQLVDLTNQDHVLANLATTAIVNPYRYVLPLIINNAPMS